MIDTILFDMDGTILNTLDDLCDSVNYALNLYELPNRTKNEVRSFLGNGIELLMKRSIGGRLEEDQENNCLEQFKVYYKENMNHKTLPYDGILSLLNKLIAKNYKIGIVSNKFDDAVKELNNVYFDSIFPVTVGSSELFRKKPDSDLVYEALRQLNSKPENTIYVGDSDVDFYTAQNSNLTFVGVTWGFRDADLLVSLGTKLLIDDPEQLFLILHGGRKID